MYVQNVEENGYLSREVIIQYLDALQAHGVLFNNTTEDMHKSFRMKRVGVVVQFNRRIRKHIYERACENLSENAECARLSANPNLPC